MQQLDKHTLHVLDVYADSPASAAGLDAFNDFVLGVGDLLFDGPDEFGEIVQQLQPAGAPLRVQRADRGGARGDDHADRHWGGDGCLGCGVGSGYLHQLPQSRTRVIPFKPSPAAKATGGDESPAPPATPPAPENAAKPPPEIPDGAFERGQSDFLAAP